MLQKYKLACQRPINHLNCLNIPQSLGLDISRGRPVNTCTYGGARSIPYHPEVVHPGTCQVTGFSDHLK